ncbi:HIRAN domain-containing protein [Bryocella elongata]|uniref:HIRAN domain-containing protein n=1 Tax=Bryocella elongata TaxID=863522 RepID=A0A1H6B4T0_9BACT|nr:HIRAN domain-containing protein [Bryocella elongata]SEG55838.1 HIRAN domain-containing protein [Bryocella elongata]
MLGAGWLALALLRKSADSEDGNIGGLIGVAVGVVLILVILATRGAKRPPAESNRLTPLQPAVVSPEEIVTRARAHVVNMEERKQALLQELVAELKAELYMARVAGVTHKNADRTSRQAELKRCEAFETLRLRSDPENKFDPNAIEVITERDRCIGYLPSETARWVADSMRVGWQWHAVMYSVDEVEREDDLKPVLGARIALLKLGLAEPEPES